MVDFNNEATISTPASDIIKVLIIQRRYDVFEALERYNKLGFSGTESDLSLLKSRLITLFLEIQAILLRRLSEKDYQELTNKIHSDKPKEIIKAIEDINIQLDKMNLIKIDTRRVYDSTRVEKEDKIKGL